MDANMSFIFANLPLRLTGRGIVEFTIEKADGSAFSPEAAGEPRSTATIRVAFLLHLY